MKKKELCTILAFSTTTSAMAMEAAARMKNFPGRLIPLPGEIAAGCGLAFKCENQTQEETEAFLEREQIKCQGIYRILL